MARQDNMRENPVWTCKIGFRGVVQLPRGSDGPMRRAVEQAFRETANVDSEFCFSGWGGQLDEGELAVVEDREPDPAKALDSLDPAAVQEVVEAARDVCEGKPLPSGGRIVLEIHLNRLDAALAKLGGGNG